MSRFVDLTLNGISNGMIYAAVALSLVLIWRATRIINFAQGGMLMITTFIASSVIDVERAYWLGFAVALVGGLALGAVVERVLVRHVEGGPPLNAVIATLGLLVLLQAVAGMIWGGTPRSFPPAFSIRGYEVSGRHVLFGPFDTVHRAGGARSGGRCWRCCSARRASGCRCAPRRSTRWPRGFRVFASLGCTPWAGRSPRSAARWPALLVAPAVFVGPNTFDAILVFAFTAAVLGGLDSPVGAVVGGLCSGCR